MKYATVVMALAFAAAAHADTVYLKSGSVLKGESGLIQDGALKFKSEDLGDLAIKVENIVKIDTVKDHVLQYNDNTKDTVKLDIRDGKLVPVGKPVDMASVKKTDPDVESWHGSIAAAFLAARGNTYDNSWSVFGNVTRRWEYDRFTADGGYYYGESGTSTGDDRQKTTDRWELFGQFDHFWGSKFYCFGRGGIERDDIKGLRARYTLGVGPGYQWLENENFEATGKWSFKQELAVQWQKEEREDDPDLKDNGYAAISYRHNLLWVPKWSDRLEVFHNFKYDPEVDDFDKYLIRADVGFSVALIYDFTFNGKIEWDFDSRPTDGRKKSDVRYIAGLGYKW